MHKFEESRAHQHESPHELDHRHPGADAQGGGAVRWDGGPTTSVLRREERGGGYPYPTGAKYRRLHQGMVWFAGRYGIRGGLADDCATVIIDEAWLSTHVVPLYALNGGVDAAFRSRCRSFAKRMVHRKDWAPDARKRSLDALVSNGEECDIAWEPEARGNMTLENMSAEESDRNFSELLAQFDVEDRKDVEVVLRMVCDQDGGCSTAGLARELNCSEERANRLLGRMGSMLSDIERKRERRHLGHRE